MIFDHYLKYKSRKALDEATNVFDLGIISLVRTLSKILEPLHKMNERLIITPIQISSSKVERGKCKKNVSSFIIARYWE